MCLCFVFREIDDQSSRSTSASTDKSSTSSMMSEDSLYIHGIRKTIKNESLMSEMFTMKEILETWDNSYGEDMIQEYSGFIDLLIKNKKM